MLGYMYQNGQGVAQDYAEAFKWYLLAAEQGEVGAQALLGYMYDKGLGVAKDHTQAAYWFRKAKEQGNAAVNDFLKELGY
jgi:TPR repeat protein